MGSGAEPQGAADRLDVRFQQIVAFAVPYRQRGAASSAEDLIVREGLDIQGRWWSKIGEEPWRLIAMPRPRRPRRAR